MTAALQAVGDVGMSQLIKDLEASQRPRERLLEHGAGALSERELIAVLLRTGRPGSSVLDEAADLLQEAGDLTQLARWPVSQLKDRPGMGDAKATTLAAALELGRRLARGGLRRAHRLDQPRAAAEFLVAQLVGERNELFGFLSLDARHRLLHQRPLVNGTRNQAPVDPAELFRLALLDHAAEVLLYHNHPSGEPEPSRDDLMLTRRLVEAGLLLGVPVVDHLVVAGTAWTSLRQTHPGLFTPTS